VQYRRLRASEFISDETLTSAHRVLVGSRTDGDVSRCAWVSEVAYDERRLAGVARVNSDHVVDLAAGERAVT